MQLLTSVTRSMDNEKIISNTLNKPQSPSDICNTQAMS